MANRKIVLRFTGNSPFKVAEQVKPGLRDDYGVLVPALEVGSWLVDEILARTTALGTTSSLSLIEYKSIPYKDA
jgi:hypothetical protein